MTIIIYINHIFSSKFKMIFFSFCANFNFAASKCLKRYWLGKHVWMCFPAFSASLAICKFLQLLWQSASFSSFFDNPQNSPVSLTIWQLDWVKLDDKRQILCWSANNSFKLILFFCCIKYLNFFNIWIQNS